VVQLPDAMPTWWSVWSSVGAARSPLRAGYISTDIVF
jgi:hypothetical protein